MDSQLSFTTFWQDIQHILLTTLNSVYKNANITASLVNSITLVYKKGDPKDIQNYRPISLLNVDYKFLNKILNDRIKIIISDIISPLQNAQPGLSTHTASVTIRNIFYQAQRSKSDSIFISLDLKKLFTPSNIPG